MWKSSLLWNRFTITFGALLIVVALWNFYVSLNDDGQLRGQVIDARGQAVAGAEVVIWRKAITGVEKIHDVATGDDGTFEYGPHGQYVLYVTAKKDDIGVAESSLVQLSFRNQNYQLAPLVLE